MLVRTLGLFFSKENRTEEMVRKSYDRISVGYDETWTRHMRDLTSDLINKLDIRPGEKVLDLTCGTGYASGLIAEKTGVNVIGIDNSEGMLQQARQNYPETCEFFHADILGYLKQLPDESADVVTCCWGLGYSKPLKVLRQIKRVLKKGGQCGIVDNTIFSLREVMVCSTLAFMEQPDKLENLMKFRFLMGKRHLWTWLRLAGLKPLDVWGGSKSYKVESGIKAIERLRATGAAAGFEYAAADADSDEVFRRFAEILEQKYLHDGNLSIIHRYLGGVAVK
ncbi:MAG: methyltransferase domain-containing protein [Phycisphaerae bacterium]|nr:methyltransferase domain-containing protein [Phycisphaerae bacterium]